MKITAVSLFLLDAFQYAHGFSFDVGSPKLQRKLKVQLNLNKYGPNWTVDSDTLGPKQVDQKCGAMVWAMSNSIYNFPEQRTDFPVGSWLQNRPKLGICMSGGGQRAVICGTFTTHFGYQSK